MAKVPDRIRHIPTVVRGDYEAAIASRATARTNSKALSRCALNATNFFLAEVVTIVVPFLVDYLRAREWPSHAIGIAAGMGGLGVFCSIIPIGIWLDHVRRRRRLLAIAGVAVGCLLGAVPLVPARPFYINALMFMAGVFESFFTPLLMALALAVASARGFNRLLGTNQAWNHVGSIASASLAFWWVSNHGVEQVFFGLTAASFLAAGACLAIRKEDLHEPPKNAPKNPLAKIRELLRDPTVRTLIISTTALHFANASILPLVVLRLHQLGSGSLSVAGLIVIAQAAMVVASYVAGSGADRWGRKPVMAFAFLVLPVRILLDAWISNVDGLMAVQILDGITFGTYAVVAGSISADVAGGKGRFATMIGIVTSTQALGAVLGPTAGGYLLEHLHFAPTLYTYAALATAGAAFFIWKMPETKPSWQPKGQQLS